MTSEPLEAAWHAVERSDRYQGTGAEMRCLRDALRALIQWAEEREARDRVGRSRPTSDRVARRAPAPSGRSREQQARDAWKVEPVRTVRFAVCRCVDDRCGEELVFAVAHPDDPEQTLNRCPTCLSTVVCP